MLLGRDLKLIHAWILAIGCAVLALGLATIPGWVIIENSVYRKIPFSPLLTVIGGLLFGLSMALSGNCGFGALSPLGGGDLKSPLIVLAMGITAYTVSSGFLSPITAWLRDIFTISQTTLGFIDIIDNFVTVSYPSLSCLAGTSLILFSIKGQHFRFSIRHLFWGIMVGLAISSGWIGMHLITQYWFDNLTPVSHRLTATIRTVILYLFMSLSGGVHFTIGSVLGVWGGEVTGSFIMGHFRLESCEDPRELQH